MFSEFKFTVVHLFALIYMGALIAAAFGFGRLEITAGDFFAQAALVLTGVGLYHSKGPGHNV